MLLKVVGVGLGTLAVAVVGLADEDVQTPTSLAREYFDALQAPKKAFVLIPGGGHMAIVAMAEAFHAALTTHVRPLAGP